MTARRAEVGVTERRSCVDLGESVGFSAASRSDLLLEVYGVRHLSWASHGAQEQGPRSRGPRPLLGHMDPGHRAPTRGQVASLAVMCHSDAGRL